jgi:hypothetical protein
MTQLGTACVPSLIRVIREIRVPSLLFVIRVSSLPFVIRVLE